MANDDMRAALAAIYTLTPTHCGTGQTSGAVDLPIAREAHTTYPIFPASSVKGVLRDAAERDRVLRQRVEQLFGSELEREPEKNPRAGDLVVTEARLVAFPVRSLSRPCLYATSAHLMERLVRDLDAFELGGLLSADGLETLSGEGARVADPELAGKLLVVEDLVYRKEQVSAPPEAGKLAEALAGLLPENQDHTRSRLRKGLVVLPDSDLRDLAVRTTPVQARVKLTSGKTTDEFVNDAGETEKGNLWYEETLPADCLMVSFVAVRAGKSKNGSIRELVDHFETGRVLQIGGNETIGQGRSWWTLRKGA